MSVIDVEKLLQDLPDSPCGEDLEYDPAFGELERSTQGKPEQQIGDTIVQAEEPSWRDVKSQALALFDRTRDLRVAVYLAQALLRTDGFAGFGEGLALVKGLLDTHWEEIHPKLDPDDNNDPTLRVNTIIQLCNHEAGFEPGSTLRGVRDAHLVSSKMVGQFGLTDVQIANGTLPATEGEEPPEMSAIEAAFMDTDLEALQETAAGLDSSIEAVEAIDAGLTDRIGSAQAPDLSALTKVLQSARKVVSDQLSRRGVADTAPGAAPAAASDGGGWGSTAAAAPAPAGATAATPAAAPAAPGEIRTREDAIQMLDKVSQYFNRHEPSSPVPLLLQRAKRLVSKSFMEIMRDLAPDGLTQVQSLSGTDQESQA
ncbi:MAG: type VI secretion system protein TssA [Planctomycetota bacterium]|jgi:type VI secretion system protein ImpA